MRRLLLLAVATATVASAAPAATLAPAPGTLVLARADVPAGFWINRAKSGIRTNEQEGREEPSVRAKFRAWHRLTGYQRQFERSGEMISSRVDLFASTSGARKLLEHFDLEMRKGGFKGLVRERVSVGDQGWLYSGRSVRPFVLVIWRHNRAFAGLIVFELTRQETLALARAQQRRIAAALR